MIDEHNKLLAVYSRQIIDEDLVALVKSDLICYREILMQFLKLYKELDREPIYGITTAYHSLLVILALDMTIFIHGAIPIVKKVCNKEFRIDEMVDSPGFEERMKSVRKGMHLYNRHGTYESKAKAILKSIRSEYHTDKKDILYPYRNDEAFIFLIDGQQRFLGGAQNIFYRHFLDYNKFTWSGADIRKYAENLVTFLFKIEQELPHEIPEISAASFLSFNSICIESFDDKIEKVFGVLSVSETSAFRIMLVLTRISYALYIYKIFIANSNIGASVELLLFFIRIFAQYLDEAADSIDNLMKHCKDSELSYLESFLNKSIWYPSEDNFDKIRQLRNLIHYDIEGILNYHVDNNQINYFRPVFACSGLTSINEVFDLFSTIISSIAKLQAAIQIAFAEEGLKSIN